ncbi:MAG: hypothetical protein ACRDF0_05245 [Candidatus Limnocylindria bacterium]
MRSPLVGALTTLLVGAMTSFVVVSIGKPLVEDSGILGRAESPAAKAYMIGLLENEADLLVALSPKGSVAERAMQFRGSEESQGQWQPVSLTYLGGRGAGGVNVQVYAIEVRSSDGNEEFATFALSLVNGKVVRRQ